MPTVLYVDQDKDYSSYMRTVLPSYGITCFSVANFLEAHQELTTVKFDCIICEWTTPGPDGSELIQLLAQHTDGSPILVVTDQTKDHIISFALEAGAMSVMEKPFSAQELADTVTQLTWSRVPRKPPCFSAPR